MTTLKTYMLNLQKTLDTDTLESLRAYTHNEFDRLWKNKIMTRNEAYTWLAEVMSLAKKDAHISLFNRDQCSKTRSLVNIYIEDESSFCFTKHDFY